MESTHCASAGPPKLGADLPILCGEAEPERRQARLRPRLHRELAQDRGDVMIDGAHGQEQALRDLAVPEPGGDELQHLGLALRQACRVLPRRRARAADKTPLPALAEAARDQL